MGTPAAPRFYTVPASANGPFENPELEAAAKTWDPNSFWEVGLGGTAWDGMAYDADLGALAAVPSYFASLDNARETSLRKSLSVMRSAIDQYHGDKGRGPAYYTDRGVLCSARCSLGHHRKRLAAATAIEFAAVQAVPGGGLEVPLWILGSSTYGAQLAAALGLPYAFASHFAPDALDAAVARLGQPGDDRGDPHPPSPGRNPSQSSSSWERGITGRWWWEDERNVERRM